MDKKIVEQLSNEFRIPEHIIERIISHPFKFQAEVMKSGSFKAIRHPFLGVFAVKPGRKEAYESSRGITNGKES